MNYRKIFIYPYLLRLRVKLLNNSQLKDKLLKRTHILDKANLDQEESQVKINEVKIHLDETMRRNLEIDNNIRWAWKVLLEAYAVPQKTIEGSNAVGENLTNLSEIEKVIKGRRSVRFWNDQPVDLEKIKEIINIAKWSPSSCNRQPWKFLILTKKEDIDRLKDLTNQDFFTKAPLVIIPLANMEKYADDSNSYAYIDIGIITQSLLLLLHSNKLGACCMGVQHKKQNKQNVKKFKKRFNIKDKYEPFLFIPVGKPAKDVPPPSRIETSEIIDLKE
jgi:nitroreductase